jgi:hypothetical protein
MNTVKTAAFLCPHMCPLADQSMCCSPPQLPPKQGHHSQGWHRYPQAKLVQETKQEASGNTLYPHVTPPMLKPPLCVSDATQQADHHMKVGASFHRLRKHSTDPRFPMHVVPTRVPTPDTRPMPQTHTTPHAEPHIQSWRMCTLLCTSSPRVHPHITHHPCPCP